MQVTAALDTDRTNKRMTMLVMFLLICCLLLQFALHCVYHMLGLLALCLAIPECLRGVFTTRHYINPRLPLPLHFGGA